MRFRKKRILSFLLAAFMLAGSLKIPTEASEKTTDINTDVTYVSDLQWEWAYAGARGKMYGDKEKAEEAGATKKQPRLDTRYGSNSPMYISYDVCSKNYKYDSLVGLDTTKKVDKGIGTEACSEIVYKLDGNYDTFKSTLAFDVYTMSNKRRPSSVRFKVLGSKENDKSDEYEVLYDSGEVYNSDKGKERPYFMPLDIAVSVRGYKYLKLWVSDANETGSGGKNPTNQSDDVNWAFARLEKKNNKEVFLSDFKEKEVVGNEVKYDTNFQGDPIIIADVPYDKGLGMKADTTVSYAINGEYEYFTTEIGFDENSEKANTHYVVYGTREGGTKDTITEGDLTADIPNKSIGGPIPGVETLELVITSESDGVLINWGDSKLEEADNTPSVLSGITLDGEALADFNASKTEYEVVVKEGERIPVVSASADENLTVSVVQAESIPGDAIITVSNGTSSIVYTVHFIAGEYKVDVTATKKELNPVKDPEGTSQLSVRIYDKQGQEITLPENAEIKYEAENLYASGDVTVATVDEKGTVTPEAGGVSRIKASVIIGEVTCEGFIDITVRPFYNDYHQSMVMKMFLGKNGEIKLNLDEGMEVIRKIDNMTLGIPKIIYLVGWQYDGHDSGYPSFAKVNEGLKRPNDASARDSLIWFMEEAKNYNTTVSLHINMLDASSESPLWDEYLEKDVIAKNEDGSLKKYLWGYPISYTAEWNAGLTQRRIDELLELLPPLKEAGTIHIDAFHTIVPKYGNEPISPYHAQKYGYTNEVEEDTQRKIFDYWHEKGLDVTSEFVGKYREDSFIGLQPLAWHFSMNSQEYLDIPASLYCGGDGGILVFGENMAGENIIKSDKENLTGFMKDFALKTMPFYYLNRLGRLDYTKASGGEKATFSNGVVSEKKSDGSFHIKQNDVVLRDDGNIFMPALWNEEQCKEIFAYSRDGYSERTWTLPQDYQDMKSVDIYQINLTDLSVIEENVDVSNGEITLSMQPDQAVVIISDTEAPSVDKSSLQKLYDSVENLQKDGYTKETWDAFVTARDNAKAVLDNMEATQEEVNTAAEQLQGAVDGLRVSKTTLKYYLDEAKKHVENGDVDNTVESIQKLFDEAIKEGEAAMEKENATKEEVMNATVKLIKAIQSLDMKPGDKTDLEMTVELADMLDLNKYVAEGQQEFKDVLTAAKDVLNDTDAMQEDIDTAWKALAEAMSNLRLKANKEALKDLLEEVEKLDLSKYTDDSVAVFEKALAYANEVMADETLSEDNQEKVDEATKRLKEAKDALVVKSETGDNTPIQNPGQNTDTGKDNDKENAHAVKTGDTAPIGVVMGIVGVSALVVLAAGMMRKKRR